MMRAQAHRGPDGSGMWQGSVGACDVILGHNRLAIIDLSEAGRQPLASPDARYQLVFNGEIYNYLELRRDLERIGVRFRTQTDTEVLLHALIRWGPGGLDRLNGMWAFAFLDIAHRRMTLARDRLGIKPLYLCHDDDRARLWFASEIKGILTATGRRFSVDRLVAGRYVLQQQLDAQPETFFTGIQSLPAASFLKIDLRGTPLHLASPQRFWTLPVGDQFEGTSVERATKVRELLIDSVKLRFRSDVPVGVLLSGGIDSSSVAAAARLGLGGAADLHLLGAVSSERAFSEEPFIDQMASHLGCQVLKERLAADPEELFNVLKRTVYHNDEPVGGLANVAHYLLMERARDQGITVLLTGQGADELTCGYLKYLGFYLRQLMRERRWMRAGTTAVHFAQNGTVFSQFTFADARRYLPRMLRPPIPSVAGAHLQEAHRPLPLGLGGGDVLTRQSLDLLQTSVPALLHYEDRMSMAHGREMRVPFLDHRLVELLQPTPPEWKLRDGWTKWILRTAMADHLPHAIAWRKDKQGFITPEGRWLARDLVPHVTRLLSEPFLTAQWGLIRQEGLRRRFEEYRRRWGTPFAMRAQDVLAPIIFEIWARTFEDALASP